MVTDLTTEVYLQMRRRKSARTIRNDLIDRGYTEEYANKLIAQVREAYPKVRASEKQTAKAMRKSEQREWGATTIGGIAACALASTRRRSLRPFWLEPFGWGIWAKRSGDRAPLIAAVFVFFGGVLATLKGVYHRLRWW